MSFDIVWDLGFRVVRAGLVPAQLSPLKIRGARGVMNRRLYDDPTTKSKQPCLRKNAINAEHASRNMMPMEITPL